MSRRECTCGKPTSGAWLCDDCCRTLAYTFLRIATYYDELDTVAAKQARYSTSAATKGSIGKAQPLPVDMRFVSEGRGDRHTRPTASPGSQVRWDTWNTVTTWCRIVLDEQPPIPGPDCGEPCLHVSCNAMRIRRLPSDNRIGSLCLYLDRQHHWIEGRDYAPVLLDEFLDIERRLMRMVDRPADRWYAGLCGTADETGQCSAELYAYAEQGRITCPGCDTEHDVASRRDYLLNEARDYLVTATEAAGALLAWTDYDGSEEKLVDRIRKWRDRKQVSVKGSEEIAGRERDLYRLGDLQDMLVRDAQRQQEKRLVS